MQIVTGLPPVIFGGTWTLITLKTEYLQNKKPYYVRAYKKAKKQKNARHKQELHLVLYALHRLLHKVHVLAPVAKRVLPARVDVYYPVHWQLA
jgi:hypothetical protein